MLVYFTASIVGKKYHEEKYKNIIQHLHRLEFDVLSDHILKTTEDDIRFEKKEERIQFLHQLERWIQSCDFMVVEATFPSISVGYEISLALHRNKPVLVLYANGDPPSLLTHHDNEKIVCEQYSSETLSGILRDFVDYIKGSADSRFTFFITPKIMAHLEHVAKNEKIPKSVYLRKLIEKDMLTKS
jgi:hypothetical protein